MEECTAAARRDVQGRAFVFSAIVVNITGKDEMRARR
jgi:hypothetical protein